MNFSELISQLVDKIVGLWPVRIIFDWEQGIRLHNGAITALLTSSNGLFGTGIHLFWPVIGDILTEDANIRVVETDIQTVTTKDGSPATVSIGIKYKIKDLQAVLLKVNEYEDTVLELARSTVGVIVPTLQWDELVDKLGAAVESSVKKRMYGWGIEVLEVAPINLTNAPAIRLIQDSGE